MQTPAEILLIQQLVQALRRMIGQGKDPLRILHIGAGMSLVIERSLHQANCEFVCDRLDVEPCRVKDPAVDQCLTASVEKMDSVDSERYDLAFANYLLEHVPRVDLAATEIWRVLKPGGRFFATVPNPRAPEFVLSSRTPLWFHRLVRGKHAWETVYAFRSSQDLLQLFENAGFQTLAVRHFGFIEQYLFRFPVLRWLGKLYDLAVNNLGIERLMGNVFVMFDKPHSAATTSGETALAATSVSTPAAARRASNKPR